MEQHIKLIGVLFAVMLSVLAGPALAQQAKKPNILVTRGDDVGIWNVSHGIMGPTIHWWASSSRI